MKKIALFIIGLLFVATSANALTLYDFFHGKLPSIIERSKFYHYLDSYRGTAEQNTKLLSDLQNPSQRLKLGATFNPTGGGTYRLQSSIGGSDTSLTLSSFKEPVSNILYTMTYLNSSIEYATIEPQNNTSKEFVSFSGITQNSDGTATITGLSRGLSFSYPYTASTTLQQSHPGQSIFILSNPPQLTNQYLNKTNNDSVSGIIQFSTAPINSGANATSTHQFVTLGELNAVSVTGAATSTNTIMGISALSNNDDMIAGSASTTLGAPKVIASYLATSSPRTGAGFVPVTDSSGKVPASFVATSSAFNFTGTFGLGTSTPPTGSFGVQGNQYTSGTSTISNLFLSSTTPLHVDGTNVQIAANQGTSAVPLSIFRDFTQTGNTGTNASTTLYTITLPANTIAASSMLRINSAWSTNGSGSGCEFEIDYGTGSATTTGIGQAGTALVGTFGPASISTDIYTVSSSAQYTSGQGIGTFTSIYMAKSTSVTTTAKSYIAFVGYAVNANSTCTFNGASVTLFRN